MLETVAGMQIARTPADVRAWVRETRAAGKRVALVPTMGALHAGHMTLVDAARKHAEAVIVTIFVNPMQFGPKEDFSAYPRPFEADCALCAQKHVDLIYAPTPETMYPQGFQSHVAVEQLTQGLCGAARPTHFRGVTTVVMKLLNIAQADVAVFGEKDYQQLQTLKRMALDLDHPTQVLGAPIAREPDGLAMSSRNVYLTPAQRQAAVVIAQSLRAAQGQVDSGERDVVQLRATMAAAMTEAGGRVDYVEIVDPASLQPLTLLDKPARVIVACWFGRARLLDNADLLP